MRGKFITFEGIDGAGKSTHIAATVSQLEARGLDVVQTREPGGTALGEKIRELFLNENMMPITELLLVFAARREHLERVIWPALDRGAWVVCDRFTDATFAYQAYGRVLGAQPVNTLADFVHAGFVPDLTIWFDVEPATAAARLAHGREGRDRFEQEQSQFFTRVRAGYAELHRLHGERVQRIDGEAPVETVAQGVSQIVAGLAEK
jgi:dTMP kinase